MSYIATIQNQTYTIDTGENGQRRSITIDGVEHAIDWRQIAALTADAKGQAGTGGRYSVIIAGKSYDVFARHIPKPHEKDSQTYEMLIAGERFEVKVEDERTRKLAGLTRAGSHTGEATIEAPMPGLVIGVPVEQGTDVSANQTVIILEAMKMENDLPSPIAGIVKEIRVSQGQAVEQGQVLMVIAGES